jgi:hypothetical protein
LFICAKNLLVEANDPTGPDIKTFETDQSFEPGARNREAQTQEKTEALSPMRH